MVEYKTGSILEEEVEALVHTVNCVGVMGTQPCGYVPGPR